MAATIIKALPFVISASGVYQLDSNLSHSSDNGHGVMIKANNVTLDLKGHSISNINTSSNTTAHGISVNSGRRNITIRNGAISGFMFCIRADEYGDYSNGRIVVENIKTNDCTFRGIRVHGAGTILRNNQVVSTGPTTFFADAFVFGIEVAGPGAIIENNTVSLTETTDAGEAVGISLSDGCVGCIVRHNSVANTNLLPNSYGIWVGGNSEVLIDNNVVSHFDYGLLFSNSTKVYYRDNTFMSCNENVPGDRGIDKGGN